MSVARPEADRYSPWRQEDPQCLSLADRIGADLTTLDAADCILQLNSEIMGQAARRRPARLKTSSASKGVGEWPAD